MDLHMKSSTTSSISTGWVTMDTVEKSHNTNDEKENITLKEAINKCQVHVFAIQEILTGFLLQQKNMTVSEFKKNVQQAQEAIIEFAKSFDTVKYAISQSNEFTMINDLTIKAMALLPISVQKQVNASYATLLAKIEPLSRTYKELKDIEGRIQQLKLLLQKATGVSDEKIESTKEEIRVKILELITKVDSISEKIPGNQYIKTQVTSLWNAGIAATSSEAPATATPQANKT
jgi:hypothetical protein